VKIRKPSPAMAVACTALFISLGGTSIAAVNYARNAGAVDGRSAVKSTASSKKAAGKLVATASGGPDKGRIPAKFLALPSNTESFGSYVDVTDNAVGAPVALGGVATVGQLTANCADQDDRPGIEDPITTITFTNTSGVAINLARRVGGQNGQVIGQEAGTIQTMNIAGSNSFELHAQRSLTDLVVDGAVRQDGRGTGAAKCLIFGTVTRSDG